MSIKTELQTLRNILYQRLYISSKRKKNVVDEFHKLYYDSFMFGKTWGEMSWMGIHIKKLPFDLWVYQEMLFQLKPDLIVECGTYKGGSSFYLASLMDIIGKGEIITIDIEKYECRPVHGRIKYLTGSTLDEEILNQVSRYVSGKETILVILDDDHSKDHVLKECRAYSKFVTFGSYLIVEDSNVNGHPVYPLFGPGPYEAIEEFLQENGNFIIDKSKELFYFSFNPNGYLKKVVG